MSSNTMAAYRQELITLLKIIDDGTYSILQLEFMVEHFKEVAFYDSRYGKLASISSYNEINYSGTGTSPAFANATGSDVDHSNGNIINPGVYDVSMSILGSGNSLTVNSIYSYAVGANIGNPQTAIFLGASTSGGNLIISGGTTNKLFTSTSISSIPSVSCKLQANNPDVSSSITSLIKYQIRRLA